MQNPGISQHEIDFIVEANKFLENPGILAKITNFVGKPLEYAHDRLPEGTQKLITSAVNKSLKSALAVAIRSVSTEKADQKELKEANSRSITTKWIHTASVTATGAIGGFFGPISLPVELPLSTGLILRGISSVADEWGHDLQDPSIQMQCLYIFTLGSKKSDSDNALESAYFASRTLFHNLIRESAKFVGQYGAKEVLQAIEKETAPTLIRFIAQVATFFELAVTEKLIAEAIPIVGALGGATINAAFCEYFVDVSRYHFGLVHLENKYGSDYIKKIYLDVSADARGKAASS